MESKCFFKRHIFKKKIVETNSNDPPLHRKIVRTKKWLQQRSRIQNQHTKPFAFTYASNYAARKGNEENSVYKRVKKNKILGINLAKKIKNLYSENYKMLLKEMKTTQITGKISMFMDWKIQYVMPILPKVTDLRQFLQSPISIFFRKYLFKF